VLQDEAIAEQQLFNHEHHHHHHHHKQASQGDEGEEGGADEDQLLAEEKAHANCPLCAEASAQQHVPNGDTVLVSVEFSRVKAQGLFMSADHACEEHDCLCYCASQVEGDPDSNVFSIALPKTGRFRPYMLAVNRRFAPVGMGFVFQGYRLMPKWTPSDVCMQVCQLITRYPLFCLPRTESCISFRTTM
jgi:hypothetical protein